MHHVTDKASVFVFTPVNRSTKPSYGDRVTTFRNYLAKLSGMVYFMLEQFGVKYLFGSSKKPYICTRWIPEGAYH